jgi:hypothetical protein
MTLTLAVEWINAKQKQGAHPDIELVKSFGKYTYHLLYGPVTMHFLFMGFLCFSG